MQFKFLYPESIIFVRNIYRKLGWVPLSLVKKVRNDPKNGVGVSKYMVIFCIFDRNGGGWVFLRHLQLFSAYVPQFFSCPPPLMQQEFWGGRQFFSEFSIFFGIFEIFSPPHPFFENFFSDRLFSNRFFRPLFFDFFSDWGGQYFFYGAKWGGGEDFFWTEK